MVHFIVAKMFNFCNLTFLAISPNFNYRSLWNITDKFRVGNNA
jgi:hypothetical protein